MAKEKESRAVSFAIVRRFIKVDEKRMGAAGKRSVPASRLLRWNPKGATVATAIAGLAGIAAVLALSLVLL